MTEPKLTDVEKRLVERVELNILFNTRIGTLVEPSVIATQILSFVKEALPELAKENGYVKLDLQEGEIPAKITKPKKRPDLILGE